MDFDRLSKTNEKPINVPEYLLKKLKKHNRYVNYRIHHPDDELSGANEKICL